MKSQESSDSGDKSQDTSLEVCRIQIKCSTVDIDPASSQDENPQSKSDTESPPIISDEAPKPLATRQSDDESVSDDEKSVKSDDNDSQKSNDAILDTSINKAYSPSSSITSQRKLEWDSLADVGYANESDKRTSATSLSTLERLALQQQYSNNDTHQNNPLGPPTSHSTPVDEADMKSKVKKGSKSTKIYSKDVDCVEVNVPQCSDSNPPQSINVNLTKHISFSVDKGGEVTVENVKKDYSLSPEKPVETKVTSHETTDKQIQTSLIKTKDKCSSSSEIPIQLYGQGVPVLINLNNLKKRQRRKKVNASKKKLRIRKKLDADKENVPVLEKSGEQVSEAESFEYMPGHIYNQNQLNKEPSRSNQTAGNKSSLESSGAATTDSSKGSKHSFTKDLENSIKLLRSALNKRYDDTELKQKLIKQVVQRLLKSNYRDDESTTDFLSGLSFSSKKLGLGGNNTTSSTSDANTAEKAKLTRPKKSILRVDKFNANAIASTSQSAPNLPIVSNSEIPVSTNLSKDLTTSHSSSNTSSKEKTSSDTAFAKTSSEELYQKYLDALKREEAYKKHLRDKEQFLKQKLVASDTGFRTTITPTLTGSALRFDVKSRLKLKELMKDLTRNNYDDGSGDASKLEGGLASDVGLISNEGRNQRRHSVFTLSSSGNSEQSKRNNLKKSEIKDVPKAGHSKNANHYCCCPHHTNHRIDVSDSSVQVNLKCEDGACPKNKDNIAMGPPCPARSTAQQPLTHIVSDDNTGDIKYLCLCGTEVQNQSDNFLIYKCSRLDSKTICCKIPDLPKSSTLKSRNYDSESTKPSKSSQTCIKIPDSSAKQREQLCIHEAIRVTQTDISINPKISDPTLSDIKITSNCDCVKLVREQFRQVSKTSIDSDTTGYLGKSTAHDDIIEIRNQPSTSNVYLRRETENTNRTTDNAEGQPGRNLQDRQTQGFYGDGGDYTIPIQGTNMTLKVSVGPNNPVTNMEVFDSCLGRPVDSIDSNEMMLDGICYNNAVETDVVGNTKNATALAEKGSKFVQSGNNNVFCQYERKVQNFNTIFTKQGNSASANTDRKQLLRSNTEPCPDTGGGTCENRKDILDDFYGHEQWSTYPKMSDRKDNTTCGPFNPQRKEDIDSGSSQNYLGNSQNYLDEPCPCPESSECLNVCGKNASCRKFMLQTTDPVKKKDAYCGVTDEIDHETCPCPVPAECANICDKNAKCWSNVRSISTGTPPETPRIPETKKREKMPCSCPNSARCGGYCGKDAACRNQADSEKKSVPPSPRKTPCSCPNSAKCGGYCGKDAACRNQADSEKRSVPLSPRKTPCLCPDSAKCGGFCESNAACRNQASDSGSLRGVPASFEYFGPPSPRKTPCGFCNSTDCKGFCRNDCRKTANECGSKVGSEPYGDSPPENSDSDYSEFIKLKNYLRSQTNPMQKKKTKCVPNPNLPNLGKPILTTDESPSEDRITSHKGKLYSNLNNLQTNDSNDLIMNVIKDVTNRYSKKDLGKSQKKKCFKEIVSILNYLLDTEEVTSNDAIRGLRDFVVESSSSESFGVGRQIEDKCKPMGASTTRGTCTAKAEENDCMTKPTEDCEKKTCDKGIQLSDRKSKPTKCYPESSDPAISSEIPCTSSDSVTCKVLNKIRNECEKYHRKCCKRHQSPKRCQCSSTTSMSCDQCKRIIMCQCRSISENCDQCKRVHHCQCRPHNRCKCKSYRPKSVCEKIKKKCVAYNLIIQTSETMIGEKCEKNCRPLKNIIVKVPPRKPSTCNVPFKELECEIEKQFSPRSEGRNQRSRSVPHESVSSTDDGVKMKTTLCTVKDYLEKNRPDFIEQSGQRQKCLKMISEARANNRSAQRELLSMQVQVEPTLRSLSESDLRALARELGFNLRQKREQPKLISEREMKNHSKKIYKKLPEVVQKKEELKKENIKKTNLLLANIFKKNLQKKALRGTVNLSNYSMVIKI